MNHCFRYTPVISFDIGHNNMEAAFKFFDDVFFYQTSWSHGEDESVSPSAAGDVARHAAQRRPGWRTAGTVWTPYDRLSLHQGCNHAANHAATLPQPPSLLRHPVGPAQLGQPESRAHTAHISSASAGEQFAVLCARYPLKIVWILNRSTSLRFNFSSSSQSSSPKTWAISSYSSAGLPTRCWSHRRKA